MAFSRLRYEAQKEREKKQEKQLGNQGNKGRVETPAPTQKTTTQTTTSQKTTEQKTNTKTTSRLRQEAQKERARKGQQEVEVRRYIPAPTRDVSAELEELVASTALRREELTARLEAARQREAEASRAQILAANEAMRTNDPTKARGYADAVKAASDEYNAIKRELEQLDYLEKYKDKTYDDTFGGQFGANKTLGRLGQDTSAAYNEYLQDPTEENKAYAEALDLLTEHFQVQNKTALDDVNAKAPWITQDLAQNLPQRWDQIKAGAAGAAAVGLPLALINPAIGVTGAKWGATAGVGKQSYDQMRGAAFQTLLNAGIDEEIARQAAGDEAVLSAMAEMADTAWTIGSAGVTAVAKAFGKGGTKAVAKEAAKGGTSLLAKALAKYGINIPQEMLEEGFQQTVSIANLERAKRGETGFWNLVGETADVARDAITGENTEARDEIVDAGWAGGKLAIMMGGVNYAADTALTTGVNSYVGKKYSDAESVQALIDSGLESAEGTESRKLAEKLQAKKQAGKTISNAEVGALQQANVAAMEAEQQTQPTEAAEEPQETLERLARETVGAQQETAESEAVGQETTTQRTSVPYNAMSADNPVRQSVVQAKRDLKKLTGYGEEGQKLFNEIREQNGVSDAELIARFDTPYQAGLTGLPMNQANLINDFQREAYNAGRLDNIARMAKDDAHKPGAILSEKESGFDFTGAPKDLTQEQKDFAVFYAKAMGVAGKFDGKNGKADYNALFNRKTGSVAFAQDFGISPELMKKLGSMDYMQKVEQLADKRERSFIFYVAHEIADHVAADRAPKQMRAFNNAMYNYLQSHPTADSETIRKKQMFYASHNVDLDAHGATEEISADNILVLYDGDEQKFMDAMRDIFNGTNEQAKEGARIYKNKLDEIISKLKAWWRKLTGKENAEARANVEKSISELEQLRSMFEEAIAESMRTVKDARAKGIDNAAMQADNDGNNIQHSMKEDRDNDKNRVGGVRRSGGEEESHSGGGKTVRDALDQISGRLRVPARRGVSASFGEKPKSSWAKHGVIEAAAGSVAQAEQQTAMDYGVPSFVISDKVWKAQGKKAPAFSRGGQIYFRETMPDKFRGRIAGHELTHVMKQVGFQPYLDFVERTPDMLDLSTAAARDMLEQTAKHRGVDLTAMNDATQVKLYDEFNATMYGYIVAGDKRKKFYEAFRDFDSYSRELTELHRQFKESRTGNQYSLKVTDKKTLDFLNEQIERGEYDPVKNPNGGYIKVYRSFQVIDGKLYAPMNAVDRDTDGKNHRLGYNSQYRVWEMATESPEIAQRYMDANPDAPYAKFDLDGVDNKTGGVAYNPYLHASNLVLNDQFSAAYRRNLVTVECYVPVSEANGAYKAQYAKDATGWVEWKPGGVAGKLMKQKPEYTRKLFVSRYMLPVREVKAPELASMYKEYLDGTNIKVPWNVVTPELRRELVKAGVGIDYKDVYQSTDKKTGEKKYAKFDEVFPGERQSQYSLKDQDYMKAVESGDMETARRMVDEAAKAAGYTLKVYHGTPKTNTEVNPNWADAVLGIHKILLPEAEPLVPGSKGFYAFDNLMRYGFGKLKPDVKAKVPGNMLRVLRQGPTRNFTSFSMSHAGESTKTADSKDGFFVTEDASFAASFMKTYEYDMFLDETRVTNFGDGSLYELYLRPDESTEYRKTHFGGRGPRRRSVVEIVVKNAEQLKSADPVTYDDDGNVVPLSERFNSENDDIRYSLKDSEGNALSKQQQEYFKDSKVRDDQGRLIAVYHSSPTAGFTVFNGEQGNGNYRFSEYGTGITFFTDNKEMAASYGDGEGSQYEGYLNITKPYVVDAKGRAWDRVSSEFSQQLYEQTRNAFTAEEKDALIDLAGWEDFAAFNEEVSRAVRDSGKPTADKHTKLLNSAFWKCSDMFALFSMAAENFSDDVIRRNSYMDLTTNQIVEKALQAGSYDGVIIKNVIDYGFEGFHTSMTPTGTDYIIFNSNQFKSKDNKSPTEDPDIRYSIKSTAHAAGLEVGHDEKGKVVFKMDGKVVTSVTADHIKNNSGLGALITVAADKGNITRADAKKQYTAMAEIMNMIMRTQDPDLVWAWVGSSMFSALKSNADGQYGTTIDFTTVCRKTQDIITAMSRAMMQMKRGLTKDEVTRLQAELIGVGSSVPCPVCYVFSRWAGIGSILDNMYRWQEKYDGYTDEQLSKRVDELTEKLGKGKAKDLKKMLREQDEEYDSLDHESEMLSLEKKQLTAKRKKAIRDNDAYTLRSVDDRLSQVEKRIPQVKKRMNEIKASVAPELAWLLQVRTDPDYAKHGKVKANVLFNLDDAATFAESYPLAWKYRTSRGPSAGKAILPYSDMRLGDMILGVDSNSASGNDLFANVSGRFNEQQMAALDKAIKRTKAQNLIGGQRFQSTSDFRYDYALDYLMAFFEAQALGSKMQTYTKIIEFADMVAAVGGDVNLSVMPKNKGFITTTDGVNRLVFSSVTGIDFEAAKRANELHDSAQLILVGINDEHILAALEDSEETQGKHIGFVIPYHASGASINEFIRVLVSNLGESFTLKYYQDYSDVQSDKERANATAAQKRRNDLRSKLLKGKDGGKSWEPNADDLAFIRGKSVDISGKSFADLRSIERKALSGNKAAIAEYESWTAGALWDLYNKMWVEGGAEYGVRLNTNQAKAVMPHEYWNKNVTRDKAYINGFLFRSYCYNLGLTPRFTGATVKGEKHGDFTDSKGYWKTLIDRPMYNNDGTYRDQQIVNMTNFQKDMLTKEYAKKHWDGYSVQEPDVVRASRAADRFIEKTQNGQYSLKGEQAMRDELARIRREGAKAGKSQADIEAEVAGVVGPEYAKLLKTYGEIERGEVPYRDIVVPKKSAKNRNVSQTIRTVLEAKATPDAAVPTIQELITQGEFSYEVYSDKAARATAEATIRNKGYETALADWLSDVKEGKVNKTNTALGWELYNAAANKGDLKTAMTILNGMVQHQRNAAQALQATRILKKMEPDAQLYGIQRSVENLQEELAAKYGKKAPNLEVDEELARKFLEAKTDKERAEAEADIYRDIGKQMPSNFVDKWNAWRYLAMLGNVRTHVRNVVGNAGFAPVVMTKNLTATAIEGLVDFVAPGKISRTKGGVNGDLLKAAWADYANADDATAGGKYNDAAIKNKYIDDGRSIFKFKPLEKARKFNSAMLSKEDMWFAQPHYAFALAQYCKANNISAEQLRSGKGLGAAREYAIREAKKATYQDMNMFSEAVGAMGRYHGDNKVKKAASVVMEGVMPFRKTPANILVRGLEYSPMGLLKSLFFDLAQVKKGNMTAAQAIDNIAAGATGSALLGLGLWLAAEGLIRGGGGGEEEEKKYAELQGHQAYALELPNGKSITLDWLAPEVLPLFVGVNLYEMAKEKGDKSNLSDVFSAVATVTEPMLEMSCLQSLNDVFDSVGYASSNELPAIAAALASAATSYLTQALPTLLGQAERSAQDVRMTTYTEKNGFLTPDMQYTLGRASSRLPGWDYQQIPYIDAWGREESTGGRGKNIANNFLNPAYTSQIETSAMEEELQRLYDAIGEGGIFPSRADKKITVDGEDKHLTAEEYVEYATAKGQLSYDMLMDLTSRPEYKRMGDEYKADAVGLAYEYANAIAKTTMSDYEPTGWVAKALEAEQTTGMDEMEYIMYKMALEMADGTNETEQKANAISSMSSLSDDEIAFLWDTKSASEAYDAGIDMRTYVEHAAAGDSINVEKLAGAKGVGVSEETYFDFREMLKEYDQPTKSGKMGSFTQDEAAAAIAAMPGLTREQRAYLWQSVNKGWKEKNNPWR